MWVHRCTRSSGTTSPRRRWTSQPLLKQHRAFLIPSVDPLDGMEATADSSGLHVSATHVRLRRPSRCGGIGVLAHRELSHRDVDGCQSRYKAATWPFINPRWVRSTAWRSAPTHLGFMFQAPMSHWGVPPDVRTSAYSFNKSDLITTQMDVTAAIKQQHGPS